LRKLIDTNATGILAVGEGVLDAVWGASWRQDPRCAPLYAGVDLTPFAGRAERKAVRVKLGIPTGSQIVAHVGNMRVAKNHPRLAQIFAELGDVSAPHLMLIGRKDPTVEAQILATLATARAQGRVHILGTRSDVPRLLKAADAFLFPSVYEGLPGSVLEARAARLPVVASDLPGVLEIVDRVDGVRALSLEQPDVVWAQALTDALKGGRLSAGALDGGCFDSRTSASAHVDAWNRSLARSN
jgi:glycosyltransferase involved in cell wall biosynthesis